ncbi:hypothetical protein [Nocardioides bruguierae]|uniref:hypothetical protein n=1 Tax=Nocardioides bruguierae TaxID=2945102 RepID=UPI0020207D8E|nr:hypothetical protein [Nocardioides bruguierae]MCL8025705.1 hypothetical protein [Nocardioides bruguierae]
MSITVRRPLPGPDGSAAPGPRRPEVPTRARRRRGRPPQLPVDTTGPTSSGLDAGVRVAWLLATTRNLHPDEDHDDRSAFKQAVVAQGVPADLSRLSRWESGQLHAPERLLAAYEAVLGTRPLGLRGPDRLLHRYDLAQRPPADRRSGRPEPRPEALVPLLEQITDAPRVTGVDWLAVARELSRFDFVFLRPEEWTGLTSRLVAETVGSHGLDQALRFEALASLLEVPSTRRQVLHALGLRLTDASTSTAGPLLALLAQVPDPAAARLALRFLDDPRPAVHRAAVDVVADLVATEQVDAVGLGVAEQHAVRGLLSEEDRGTAELANLLAALPSSRFSRVLEPVRGQHVRTWALTARETGLLLPEEVVRVLVRRVAGEVQVATPSRYVTEPDQMLATLVTEVLVHVSGQRRRLAAWTLAASPYAPACIEVLAALADTSAEPVRERAREAARLLAGPEAACGRGLVDGTRCDRQSDLVTTPLV